VPHAGVARMACAAASAFPASPCAGDRHSGAMRARGYLSEKALECSGHRPPRSPPRKPRGLQPPIAKLLGVAGGSVRQKRNWGCIQRGGMDHPAFLDEESGAIPRPVVRLPHVADGSDSGAAALRNKRRLSHGGTPTRPEDNGALRTAQGSPSLCQELLQVLARAMLRRHVAERAGAAAAAAKARTGGVRTGGAPTATPARVALLVARATVAADAVASAEREVIAATATDAAVALLAVDGAARALVTERAP